MNASRRGAAETRNLDEFLEVASQRLDDGLLHADEAAADDVGRGVGTRDHVGLHLRHQRVRRRRLSRVAKHDRVDNCRNKRQPFVKTRLERDRDSLETIITISSDAAPRKQNDTRSCLRTLQLGLKHVDSSDIPVEKATESRTNELRFGVSGMGQDRLPRRHTLHTSIVNAQARAKVQTAQRLRWRIAQEFRCGPE